MSTVRTRTRTALVTALQGQPGIVGVAKVSRSFPGKNLKNEHVYVIRCEGTGTLPTMMSGHHEREDSFRIFVWCQSVKPGQDSTKAETACESFMDAVLVAVADAQEPGGLLAAIDELVLVNVGEVNGPDAEPTPQGEGYGAFGLVEVLFEARIS